MSQTQAPEFLRLEGVYKSGYGIVPKFVMHDPDLSIESKAIYAYLCALSGSGEQTFPYRETILRQLRLAKNTYYNHYKPLIEHGYITVERPPDKSAANIYTLISNPKKLLEVVPQGDGILGYLGLKSHGFGSIPRSVMTDDRLSIKAKGLYAYFCSYCGAGKSVFPRKDHILHHLKISEPTYYKMLNLLKQYDYIQTEQRKVSGMFSVNDYYLNEFPNSKNLPHSQICNTENSYSDAVDFSPSTNFCDIKKRDIKSKDTNSCDIKIKDTLLITNTSKNKNINNNLSNRSNHMNKKRTSRTTSYDLSDIERMFSIRSG